MSAAQSRLTPAMDQSRKRDQAVDLARQGFRVFPLGVGAKEPAYAGWQNAASSDPQRAHAVWSEAVTGDPLDYNIGIATGQGLIVTDVDDKNGKDGKGELKRLSAANGGLPRSLVVQTASGGYHIYLRVDPDLWAPNSASKIAPGIDIRGDGGYVVGPGSIVAGKPYIAHASKIAAAPDWLVALVVARRPEPANSDIKLDEGEEQLAATRAIEWLKRHAPLARENDGGDDATYRVAARVMDFGVGRDMALELLLDHWNDRCEPPWEPEALEVKVANAAAYRHKPIGADSADAEFEIVELAEKHPEEAWPAPQNLWEDPAKSKGPSDLAEDVFPPVVQGWIDDEAERKGVSRGAATTLALGMFAGCISARYQVQVKQKDTGFKNRPTIWAMAVGGPGSGKSPIQSAIMRPLTLVERERRHAYQTAMRAFEAAQKAEKQRPPTSGSGIEDASKPRNRCRIVQDATAEAVVLREAQSGHGVTIALDELDGFFGGLDAYRSGKGSKDAPFYLAGKNGEAWEVSRVSRDAVSAELHAVNIIGGIQPGVVRKATDAMGGNGMMQRFLICIMGQSRRAPDRAPDEQLAGAVEMAAQALSGLEPDSTTPHFKMHPEADACRERIVDFSHAAIARGNLPVGLRGWLDKMEGEWARIALILHLVEWASSSDVFFDDPPLVISPETARRAERFLLGYQWDQQRFFYEHVVGGSGARSDAPRKIADHILAHELREVSNREITQKIRSIEDRQERAAAMGALERAGWLRPISPLKDGAPIRWAINPAVHDLFSARAIEEARRKFGAREAILQAGSERRATAVGGA